MQDLDEAVMTYLDVADRIFQQARQHAQPQPAIRVLSSPTQLFRQAVSVAEESEAFTALVGAAMEAFAPDHRMMPLQDESRNVAAISLFFRRSGVYRSHFSGEIINRSAITDSLRAALSATTHRVKYLAPLENVSFGAETIECGSYQIRKYSRQQLEELLENDLRSAFFQDLQMDTAALEKYWFIVVEGTEPHPLCFDPGFPPGFDPESPIIDMDLEGLPDSSRPVEFSPYPQVLDKALRRFALFSWNRRVGTWFGSRDFEEYEHYEVSLSPQIPFVITISDSPFVPPAYPPDMRLEPTIQSDIRDFSNLNESRTLDFARWMQHIDHLFEVVSDRYEQWRFIEAATGFLLKGFLTSGLESLLWNVASIEALLGDRDPGLTGRLITRLTRVLGQDEERRKIRKLFKEIYELRSAVVHGDARLLGRRVVQSQVIQARDLACLLLVWMLSWLGEVGERWEQTPLSLPTREQLLAVLDLAEGELDTVAKLLGAVPSKFPHVPAWLDPEQLGERWRAEDESKMAEVRDAFGV